MFLKKHCKYTGVVHERIAVNGNVGFFKNKIDHFSYRDYDHYISKMNHYAAIRAKELHEKGQKVTIYHIMIKPAARFFRWFLVAKTQAYGVLTGYIKLWLLKKKIK